MTEVQLTREVAEFIVKTRSEDIPNQVIQAAKKSILDGLGLAVAARKAETYSIASGFVRSLGAPTSGAATEWGSDDKFAPSLAAFVNGVGIHADDYDDTQLAVSADRVYGLLTHPTAPALPPALAIAETRGLGGRDLLLGYLVGVEVESKVAEAIHPRHYQHGFHATGTCGAIGSGAAASKLMGFDEEKTAVTLGLSASQAAGLRENFGTMTKPFHAGRAASAGVVAAEFVDKGWTASSNILEADRGFFRAAGGGFDIDLISGQLGNPWTFDSPGVSIKPHPCGSLTHPGMTEMLRLIESHDIRPEDVRKVSVGTNSNMPNALIHHRPVNSLQAKFSFEFCMAILLLERRAGLREFTDETVLRDDVQQLLRKVDFGVHQEAENAGYDKMTTIIDIEMNDGSVISGRADFGKGSPMNPMSYDEVAEKFMECVEFAGLPHSQANEIISMVAEIETLDNIATLMSQLNYQK